MTKRILANKKQKMQINTLIDMEETMLRIKLKQDQEFQFQIFCAAATRPDASLRQLNNSISYQND